jgi:hypothetical protein
VNWGPPFGVGQGMDWMWGATDPPGWQTVVRKVCHPCNEVYAYGAYVGGCSPPQISLCRHFPHRCAEGNGHRVRTRGKVRARLARETGCR